MKRYTYENLKDFGVRFITGEACGLSMRVLVGITEKAWPHVLDFFGLSQNTPPNPFITGEYSSMMLTNSIADYLLAYLVLVNSQELGVSRVLYAPGGRPSPNESWHEMAIYAQEGEDDPSYNRVLGWYREHPEISCRQFQLSNDPGDGFRNRHHFTGALR